MKKILHKIKGFTLTELAIVIAVIAVLIAVLVPTFISLINSANETSDMVLVSNLNKSLSITDEPDTLIITDNGTDKTVYNVTTAITSVRADGYDVSKLSPTADGGDIVYNASTNKFLYYADNFSELAYGDEPESTDVLVIVTDSTLSRYGLAEESKLTGDNTIQYCVYSVESASISTTENATIWLYTENITPTVDASKATVYHYGSGTYAYISDVDSNSYHLYGSFNTIIALGGHIDTTKGNVKYIYIPSEHADSVIVDKNIDTAIYSDSGIEVKSSDENTTHIVAAISEATDVDVSDVIDAIKETAQTSYSDTVITEATCEEAGSIVYTSADGTTKTVTIPATGHSYEITYSNPTFYYGKVKYDLTYTCTQCEEGSKNHTVCSESAFDPKGENYGYTFTNTSELIGYDATVTGITDLVIPEGVTQIGDKVFYKSSLTSIVIPSSVTYIGEESFRACSDLKSIYVEGNTSNGTIIGAQAFCIDTDSSIETIYLGEGVTTIMSAAFTNVDTLKSISLPDTLEYVASTVFSNSSIAVNSTELINLANTDNSGVTIYENGVYVGNSTNPYVVLIAALDKTVTEFTIQSGTKIIYSYAFYNKYNSDGSVASSQSGCTSLLSLDVPEGVVQIVGSDTFKKYKGEIILPSTLKYLTPTSTSSPAYATLRNGEQSNSIYYTHITAIFYNGTEEQWYSLLGIEKENVSATAPYGENELYKSQYYAAGTVYFYDKDGTSGSYTTWYLDNNSGRKVVTISGGIYSNGSGIIDYSTTYNYCMLSAICNADITITGGTFNFGASSANTNYFTKFKNNVTSTGSTLKVTGGVFRSCTPVDYVDSEVYDLTEETIGSFTYYTVTVKSSNT